MAGGLHDHAHIPKGGIGSDTQEAAATLLKSFFAACAASATTSLSTSLANLPRCRICNMNGLGPCRHVREVVGEMEHLYGQSWKQHQVHRFLAETCKHPTCDSLQHWRQLVLQECCTDVMELLDLVARP